MIEIDLHGIRHKDVYDILEHYINNFWGSNKEMQIITGYSPKMKQIVIDILDKYNLQYTIGDFSGINNGFIKTILD